MLGRMVVLVAALVAGGAGAQEYYGDFRPDAPELAARGALQVGVRTLVAENQDQLDVLRYSAEQTNPRYTRKLTLEVWYPARLTDGQKEHTVYTDVLGSGPNDRKRPNTPFQFNGRAARDAAPTSGGRYPLVIVSHGYPGSRLQMSYLTENLASKGYVVVAIDHPESTRADKGGFASTLLNRRLDDLFVLNTVAALAKPGSGNFLAGLVDADNTALVGYSMGGYGALNTVGAGVGPAAAAFVPGGKLAINQQGNPEYEAARDPRIKAVVAFAPWGANYKVWDDAGLAGVRTPTLFITGDQDDVAGYQDGVLQIFQKTVNADRYLLTYVGGRHNSAPNPPSPAHFSNADDFQSYSEPVWDSRRINNINQHFVTAFLGVQLKQQPLQAYLQLSPQSSDEWKGFSKRNALGLEWRHQPPQ